MKPKSTDTATNLPLQHLPSVDLLLRDERARSLVEAFGKDSVKQKLVDELSGLRKSIIAAAESNSTNAGSTQEPSIDASLIKTQIIDQVIDRTTTALTRRFSPSIRPVINLTGIMLHTNLGRAPYPQAAIDAMLTASGAANVEYDLSSGTRGKRDDHVAHWICELTGAEAATVVNNNAAAVLLVLNTLAEKKQVVVSRGELIEIGGSFRMPDIMLKARCKLIEVGTTNRTHLYDYKRAINKKTAALMKVHTSNFEIAGFGHSVSVTELKTIAADADIPVIDDMGSGNLLDLESYGLPGERTARQALSEGADIITFSGDKLLGGPQCGLIAGKRKLIEKINQNPFKRTMRLDKVTLAALEAVLKLYSRPETLTTELPILSSLTRPTEDIATSANKLAESFRHQLSDALEVSVRACESQIGSGSLPTKTIPSLAVVLTCKDPSITIQSVADTLRSLPTPVIGRVYQNALWLDCRLLTDHKCINESISCWPNNAN